MEIKTRKKIILVGDKVLISPDKESERTAHGLYLPPGVKEKDKVQSGYVVRIGPGYAVPNPQFIDQESWSTTPKDPVKYIPLQAEEGDYAIFLARCCNRSGVRKRKISHCFTFLYFNTSALRRH